MVARGFLGGILVDSYDIYDQDSIKTSDFSLARSKSWSHC